MCHIPAMEYYYHIYNRGAHKEKVFLENADYWRMLKLLYIANNTESFEINKLKNKDFFSIERKGALVDIIAYCLMPNHFHIYLKIQESGDVTHPRVDKLTRFLRKLCTGYSNYYNIKYDHSGTIWQGACKKKDVVDELHRDTMIRYVHLNPHKPGESDSVETKYLSEEALECSKNYEFSSLKDYLGEIREQGSILFSEYGDVTHPPKTTQSTLPSPS